MASSISAGTTSSTALVATADTTGALVLQTNNGTTALTLSTAQNATFAGTVTTNTIGSAAATALTVQSAGTTALTVDTSQNVLVGATSFAYTAKVNVSGSQYMTGGSYESWAGAYNLYNSANNYIGIQWYKSATGSLSGSSRQAVIECQVDNKLNIKTDVNIPIYVIANASNGVYLSGGGTSWTSNSDERLKSDLKQIEDAANKVATLRAVTGRFKTDKEGTSRSFLIAQDVQKVFPEAVNVQDDENKTLGIQYTDIIPLLVAAIQELTAKVTALEAKVGASA